MKERKDLKIFLLLKNLNYLAKMEVDKIDIKKMQK